MITLKSAREIEAMDKAGDFLASIHIGLRMCVVAVKKKMFFLFKLELKEALWIILMLLVVPLMMK